MLRKKFDFVLTRSQLSVEKECYSLNGTFLNAVNRQKSKQLQNHRKTPCVWCFFSNSNRYVRARVACVRARAHVLTRLTIHWKYFIVTNSIGSRNDSTRPAEVSLIALSMVWKCFWNGFTTHFASVETHWQRFKTHWKYSSTHFQYVENALQRKSASTLF